MEVRDEKTGKNEVYRLTKEEFDEPFQDKYLEKLANLSYAELDDKYNPGPTLPDGGVNFECHCVGHLVASPCGYEFREAIKCQKAAGDNELEEGACAEQFMEFMKCVVRTGCFRSRRDDSDEDSIDITGDDNGSEKNGENTDSSSNTEKTLQH